VAYSINNFAFPAPMVDGRWKAELKMRMPSINGVNRWIAQMSVHHGHVLKKLASK
jgi:hypothetical protein